MRYLYHAPYYNQVGGACLKKRYSFNPLPAYTPGKYGVSDKFWGIIFMQYDSGFQEREILDFIYVFHLHSPNFGLVPNLLETRTITITSLGQVTCHVSLDLVNYHVLMLCEMHEMHRETSNSKEQAKVQMCVFCSVPYHFCFNSPAVSSLTSSSVTTFCFVHHNQRNNDWRKAW